jgi:hypothetical protein
MNSLRFVVSAVLTLGAIPAYAASLLLIPTGQLVGEPGDQVGWGFTIQNAEEFLVVESSDFCSAAFATPCTNDFGTYTDFAGPQFIVVGPAPESSVVSEKFDLAKGTGLGSFMINPPANAGIPNISGNIFVVYSLYHRSPNDPAFDPLTDLIAVGNRLTAPASVILGNPNPIGVAEPETLGLAGLALSVLAGVYRLRQSEKH